MSMAPKQVLGGWWVAFAGLSIASASTAVAGCSGPASSGTEQSSAGTGAARAGSGSAGEPSPVGGSGGARASGGGQAGSAAGASASAGTGTAGASAGSGGSAGILAECSSADDCAAKPKDLCRGEWQCESGSCVQYSAPAVDCSSVAAEPCHDVKCDPHTGTCVQVATQSASACGDDCCTAGKCVPGTGTCRPQITCKGCESCDTSAQACVPNAGSCSIEGQCFAAGALKTSGGCLQCNPASATAWSPVAAGSDCQLQDKCFVAFQCSAAGVCEGAVPVAPAMPMPARPISGARTGSMHAPAARGTLRPKFVWNASAADGCAPPSYELEVDDSCTTVKDCGFPTPAIHVTTSSTSYRAEVDLEVSSVAPVGRRYYWRVRACRAQACSVWSSTRYLDVGRAAHDYNGDGYTDLNFSSSIAGPAGIFYGSALGPADTVTRIATDHDVTYGDTGDINGDGFDDLLLSSAGLRGYFGSADGLPDKPTWTLNGNGFPFVQADFDGDGYPDAVVVGSSPVVMADYFAGSASGLPAKRTSYFINPLLGDSPGLYNLRAADFNGDGMADLAGNSLYTSYVYTYLSGPSFPMAAPNSAIKGLAANTDSMLQTAIFDTDGDLRDDITIATVTSPGYPFGVLYQYRSQGSTFPATATLTLPDTSHPATDAYGEQAISGDLMGRDGLPDLVVTAPQAFYGAKFYVYAGTALQSTPPLEIYNPSTKQGWWFGNVLKVGDFNGDGDADLVVCDSEYSPKGRALVYYGPLDKSTVSPNKLIDAPAGFNTFCTVMN